jgi:hypothetical protein
MDNNPFDNLEISLEQAIDRLEKFQPVYATFNGGGTVAITAIFANEVLTITSVRSLTDVVFFSSELTDQESDRFDFDDKQLETTVP